MNNDELEYADEYSDRLLTKKCPDYSKMSKKQLLAEQTELAERIYGLKESSNKHAILDRNDFALQFKCVKKELQRRK